MVPMHMNDDERNQLFRQIADSFIDVANRHTEDTDNGIVSSALLYGTARFSAFVVASNAKNLERYEADRDAAIEYFTSEFRRMLEENLDNYKSVFKEQPRYAHLMKNNDSEKEQ